VVPIGLTYQRKAAKVDRSEIFVCFNVLLGGGPSRLSLPGARGSSGNLHASHHAVNRRWIRAGLSIHIEDWYSRQVRLITESDFAFESRCVFVLACTPVLAS
jgi:hypothetical protein